MKDQEQIEWRHLVTPQFETWIDAFEIEPEMERAIVSSAPWMKKTVPDHLSPDQETLGFMMVSFFFYLDDYGGGDFEEECDRFIEVIDNSSSLVKYAETRTAKAFCDFIQRVASLTPDASSFCEEWREVLDGFKRERDVEASLERVDLEVILGIRHHTIFVRAWVEFWSIVGGFFPEGKDDDGHRLGQIKASLANCVLFSNELFSYNRDRETGDLNIIIALEAMGDGEEKEAPRERVVSMYRDARREFYGLCKEVDASSGLAEEKRLVAFMRKIERQNIRVMDEDVRYTAQRSFDPEDL